MAVRLRTDKHQFIHWVNLSFAHFAAKTLGIIQKKCSLFQVILNFAIVSFDILDAANATLTSWANLGGTISIWDDDDIRREITIHSLIP